MAVSIQPDRTEQRLLCYRSSKYDGGLTRKKRCSSAGTGASARESTCRYAPTSQSAGCADRCVLFSKLGFTPLYNEGRVAQLPPLTHALWVPWMYLGCTAWRPGTAVHAKPRSRSRCTACGVRQACAALQTQQKRAPSTGQCSSAQRIHPKDQVSSGPVGLTLIKEAL